MGKKSRKKKKKAVKSKPSLIIQNPFEDPIIPTRMAWSISSLKLFRKCKRKHFWKSILRLSPKREAAPFVISGGFHEGVAKWYKSKKPMRAIASVITKEILERLESYADYYDQEEYDELTAAVTTITGMLVGYAREYSEDRTSYLISKKDVEVWFQANMGDFDFKGKIDLLFYNKAHRQLLMEHKAVKKISGSSVETLPMDSQLRGYILGATKGLGRPPVKVIYNLVRKCQLRRKTDETIKHYCDRIAKDYVNRPDFYFSREPLRYSKEDIVRFEADLRRTHAEYDWFINYIRDPLEPLEWPCDGSDHVCKEFFRTCTFFPLCIQGLDKGTAALYTQYNKGEILDSEA